MIRGKLSLYEEVERAVFDEAKSDVSIIIVAGLTSLYLAWHLWRAWIR